VEWICHESAWAAIRGWKRHVRSSVVHILALSYYIFTAMLAKAALSKNRQVRLQAQIDRRNHEIALLQELRSALKVLESAKYPTIQFRHITSSQKAYYCGFALRF